MKVYEPQIGPEHIAIIEVWMTVHRGTAAVDGKGWRSAAYAALGHEWFDRAACGPYDSDLFFPADDATLAERRAANRAAQDICATCPVQRQCAAWGTWEEGSVVGGRLPAQRKADRVGVVDEIKSRLVIGEEGDRCGTSAGYQRHRARGEAPCASCARAENEQLRKKFTARRRDAAERREARKAQAS